MGNLGKYRLYKLYSYLAFIAPFGVLFGLNHEAYITFTDGIAKASWASLGLGGYIIAMILAIRFKTSVIGAIKKDPVLTMGWVMITIAGIMMLIAEQMLFLGIATVTGCYASRYVEPVADVFYNRCYKLNGDKKMKIITTTLTAKEAWRQAYRGVEML